MKRNVNSMYLAAGLTGFVLGVLYAPDKGKVSRLKLKRGIHDLASKTVAGIEEIEKQIEES